MVKVYQNSTSTVHNRYWNWATSWEKTCLCHMQTTKVQIRQPMLLHRLINTFVVRFRDSRYMYTSSFDSIIPITAISKLLVSVVEHDSLSLPGGNPRTQVFLWCSLISNRILNSVKDCVTPARAFYIDKNEIISHPRFFSTEVQIYQIEKPICSCDLICQACIWQIKQ